MSSFWTTVDSEMQEWSFGSQTVPYQHVRPVCACARGLPCSLTRLVRAVGHLFRSIPPRENARQKVTKGERFRARVEHSEKAMKYFMSAIQDLVKSEKCAFARGEAPNAIALSCYVSDVRRVYDCGVISVQATPLERLRSGAHSLPSRHQKPLLRGRAAPAGSSQQRRRRCMTAYVPLCASFASARGESGKKEANLLRVVAAHEGSERIRHVLETAAEAVTSLEAARQSLLVSATCHDHRSH